MACYSPILVPDPRFHSGKIYMQVPCGKCLGCLKSKQNSWSIRVQEQLNQCPNSCFITLTYSDENVPMAFDPESGEVRQSLHRKDFQDWIRRVRDKLRYKFGPDYPKLQYFMCGEYGTKTFRPHYHAIIFGMRQRDFQFALDDWYDNFGFYNCQDIGFSDNDKNAVGLYVGKYASKGVYSLNSPLLLPFMEKPFVESSHCLGRQWIEDKMDFFSLIGERKQYKNFDAFMDDFLDNFRYRTRGGFEFSMPRYYKDYFFKHVPGEFYDSVMLKTNVNILDLKLDVTQANYRLRNGLQTKVPATIPNFRDTVALAVLRRSDRDYRDKLVFNEDPDDSFTTIQMVEQERSLYDSLAHASERKLDSAYLRSKV